MLGPTGTPLGYYQSYTTWDNLTHTVMNAIMIWIADALVIYRCYMIWGSSAYQRHVIVLPILLLLSAMGVNITLMVYYKSPFMPYEDLRPVLVFNYPLFFVQNVTTTGLIGYKLIQQHTRSEAVGILAANIGKSSPWTATVIWLWILNYAYFAGDRDAPSLLTAARIIIESALLYTVEMAVLSILNFVDHPSQYIVRGAIIPTIGESVSQTSISSFHISCTRTLSPGIVFLLIAIRVHFARESHNLSSEVAEVPAWAMDTQPTASQRRSRLSAYGQTQSFQNGVRKDSD